MSSNPHEADADDVLRLTRWAVAKRYRRLAGAVSRVTGMSWGDIASEVLVGYYERGFLKRGDFALSTLIDNQTRWTLYRLWRTRSKIQTDMFSIKLLPHIDQQATSPVDEQIAARELWAIYRKQLTSRHRTVIELRYGLDGAPMMLRECSKLLKISTQRVRQIESTALRRVSEYSHKSGIYPEWHLPRIATTEINQEAENEQPA